MRRYPPYNIVVPTKLALAHLPTPLRLLPRLSALTKSRIWLKSDDISGFALGGNKVRKLEFLLADAVKKGATTIITSGGVQSNHCRATAFACAQLGLKCHLILRDDPPPENAETLDRANHFLDQLCGASYELHSQRDYQHSLTTLFELASVRIEEAGGTAYAIPTGGSNGLGAWGYIQAAEEILSQCQQEGFIPDLVVCASGSGGTQAGLVLGMLLLQGEAHIPTGVLGFAVCDSKAYFDKKIRQDMHACCVLSGMPEHQIEALLDIVTLHCNDQYIGPGYAKAYPELYQTLATLARLEGVLLDPVYTGKAMHGLISELSAGRLSDAKNIVFVHTGGAFGLFPHADCLLAETRAKSLG